MFGIARCVSNDLQTVCSIKGEFMEKKPDRRVSRTLKLIDEAMLGLLEKKPIAEISVTELCEAADINRNTFYSHYGSTADVLRHLEETMAARIGSALDATSSSKDATEHVLIALQQEERLSRILLSDRAGTDFSRRLFDEAKTRTLTIAARQSSRLSLPYQDMLAEFSIAGGAAVIRKWVERGMKEPAEDIAKFIRIISNYGSSGVQKEPDQVFRRKH